MPLAEANINVDMIIQVVSDDSVTTDITFTVPAADFERAETILEARRGAIGYAKLQGATDVVKVSAIGVGMRSHAGVAARAFKALAEKGINIRAITTSEIKFSVLIDAAISPISADTTSMTSSTAITPAKLPRPSTTGTRRIPARRIPCINSLKSSLSCAIIGSRVITSATVTA